MTIEANDYMTEREVAEHQSGRDSCPDCGCFFGVRDRGEDGRCRTCTTFEANQWPDADELIRWAQQLSAVVVKVLTGPPHLETCCSNAEDIYFAARTAGGYALEALRQRGQ